MSRPNRPNPQVVARAMARDLMRHFELTEFAHPVREIQRNQIFAIEILASNAAGLNFQRNSNNGAIKRTKTKGKNMRPADKPRKV
jgi:hypothetical protein